MRLIPGVPLVSCRSLINVNYVFNEGEDYYVIASTKGNEHLIEQHKDKIGDDVIATMNVNYISMKPKLDSCGEVVGTTLTQVYSFNPAGNLPSILTNEIVKK